MRGIISSAIFLFLPFLTYAQSGKNDLKIMMDSAIQIKYLPFADHLKKDSTNEMDLYLMDEQNRPLDYLHLPANFKFKFINIFDSQNRKTLIRGIHAWKVITYLNKNQFVIDIIDFRIKYKKKNNYDFSNGGGAKVLFEYDCNENKWKLVSSQDKGI